MARHHPRETAINRAAAERLSQAEALLAMRGGAYPADEFYAAWRNVVLYDEHTWGAHNSISQPDAPFVKSQWAIKQAYALDAEKQSRNLLDQAIGTAAAVENSIDVFNTSSWPRTDLVMVPKELSAAGDIVKDGSGAAAPSQRLSSGELAFVAKNVPAFGAKRYSITAGKAATGKAKADGATITSGEFTIRIDEKTGAIVSLKKAGSDAEMVDGRNPVGINGYLYLPGTNPKDAQANGPVKIVVKESGPLVASLLVESDAPGCNNLSREVRLVDGLDRVDIIDIVDKKPIRQKEGVHIGFALNVPGGVTRMDVPYAVVRPELDQIPGAARTGSRSSAGWTFPTTTSASPGRRSMPRWWRWAA